MSLLLSATVHTIFWVIFQSEIQKIKSSAWWTPDMKSSFTAWCSSKYVWRNETASDLYATGPQFWVRRGTSAQRCYVYSCNISGGIFGPSLSAKRSFHTTMRIRNACATSRRVHHIWRRINCRTPSCWHANWQLSICSRRGRRCSRCQALVRICMIVHAISGNL